MSLPIPHPDFNPEFAGPRDWAAMYRACGLQIVPCRDKRPMLAHWRDYQNDLIADPLFDQWYGATGKYHDLHDMGVLTGPASGGKIMVDLDTYKPGGKALAWWQRVLAVHNNGLELETWEQTTGGGGRQMFFELPPGIMFPNARTDYDVDIRGKGGFAVLPPTLHASGNRYVWKPGRAPWECPILLAPAWLVKEIADLIEFHGGGGQAVIGALSQASVGLNVPNSGTGQLSDFGKLLDGREEYMATVVWAAVVDLYRECPIRPNGAEQLIRAGRAYEAYERNVESRVPGVPKRDGLEAEKRGQGAFLIKWDAAMRHWDDRVAADASVPSPTKDIWRTGGGGTNPVAGFVPSGSDDFGSQTADPGTGKKPDAPLLLTAKQFVDGFTPPAYLIDGMLQRGYLYSLTARTGHGKTAVAMYMAQAVARGVAMHGRATKGGTVLLLAGENPDDIRARYLVLAEVHGFKAENLKIRFIAGIVSIPESLARIEAEAAEIDDLMMVIVDTAAAYFPGDETNSNSQQGAYARLLRRLTFLRGKPLVLVNCHPVKNASKDNLLPMGGSAFVNEVDGNLTLWSEGDKQLSLHWQGKFRGPEFEPVSFELRVAESSRVIDADGRLMPSVVALPISEITVEAGEQFREADENRLMRFMHANERASFSELASKMGFTENGAPQKYRVQRIIARLKDDKMVEKYRGGRYRLTRKGEEEIGVAGGQNDD